jgi:hypothetical protein
MVLLIQDFGTKKIIKLPAFIAILSRASEKSLELGRPAMGRGGQISMDVAIGTERPLQREIFSQ